MKQVCLLFLLGCLLIAEGICPAAATRHFRDVMSRGRASSHNIFHRRLNNWSSDHNNWNDKLYPYWEEGDPRWKDCWKGGRVVANLTSDSPALIGSNVTFTVTLKFPRCQREDNDSNIVYDRNCVNGSSDYSDLPDQYVYNWTKWIDDCGLQNCTHNNSHNVFPDGRPFPHHRDWRRRNFVYIFHTLGQYYQKTGGSSAMVSINTTNITLGQQIMEVSIYRRSRASYVPVTTVNVVYVLTDKIPFHVKISQKNDRNASDHIFIKDQPITFEVQIHDPSHYLNDSVITYHWNFGDGSGSFVSNNSVFMHTYTLLGNFSLNLSVQAIIPTTCGPITPTPPLTTLPVTTQLPRNVTTPASDSLAELPTEEAPDKECHITRYGPYKGSLFVVEGILGVNIIQMTSVQVASTQAESSVVDFVVTCQGSLPTDACTIIADPTCQVPQSEACDLVDIEDECLLTISRAFNGSGTYCVNITLADEASLALTSTLVSINGAAGSFSRTAEGVLIACGFLVIVAVVLTLFLYKRYKQYKPIERKAGEAVNSERLSVYFNNVKAVLFPANNERHPLLNNKPGIV
ncbi:transmembrane glycoprotein NMB isoform X2 [Hemicordylus capensis]|uniref:transmembrane glycoprotein NMB isoform X2 n=1 Tax=Hemicordylus capensis TaxID=884348 RepID=UPI002304313F|nr:transmembrane glycoprotein NMB isoform X2 [Hemicordylus capensis]